MIADIETLRALLARVKEATGPDRELDAEIIFDLFSSPVGKKTMEGLLDIYGQKITHRGISAFAS